MSSAAGAPESATYTLEGTSVNTARVYDPTWFRPLEMKTGPGVVARTGLQEANVLFSLAYTYEANGNVLTMKRTWRPSYGASASTLNGTYAYDTLNRLKDFSFTGTEFPGTNHYTYAMDEYGNLLGEQKGKRLINPIWKEGEGWGRMWHLREEVLHE